MYKIKIFLSICTVTLLLNGCAIEKNSQQKDFNYRENILLKTNNYDGLVNLYRDALKKKEDPEMRMKLSQFYYLNGDSQSSLNYLQPLMHKPSEQVYLLQTKNLIVIGENKQALQVANKILQINPRNADAYNLRGIALVNSGRLSDSAQAIGRSRELFIADDIALNNLAVVAILDGRYNESVHLLLPQYLRGRRDEKLIHNLVFSLIQVGDTHYARDIIESEKLSDNPEGLIEALSQVSKLKKG